MSTGRNYLLSILLALLSAGTSVDSHAEARQILNASYGVSREFYREFDEVFRAHWKQQAGEDVVINQSHGQVLLSAAREQCARGLSGTLPVVADDYGRREIRRLSQSAEEAFQ